MATLVLTAVTSVLTRGAGGWLGILAGAAASVAGGYLDSLLFGKTVKQEGPRLDTLQVQASTEGATIPEIAGRVRLSGQIIWASRLKEVATTEKSGGGKGGGGGSVQTTTYTYYANFAVALCEGVIDRVGRVWADGKPLDMKSVTMRVYKGTAAQNPDSLIQGIEGAASTPAYRGTAYVVFDTLDLTPFGNRIPQLSFEVFRRVSLSGGTALEDAVKAVTLIPGAGEFAYDTVVETRDLGGGATVPENRHSAEDSADWTVALDDLEASLPNAATVLLVVGWFGDDLRCGQCTVRPKVETATKTTTPSAWLVHTLTRSTALVVSSYGGTSAYGGTPSDQSIARAIRDLKARGYSVVFYPFLFMDVAQGNMLPNPYGGTGQPAYPWRGRITCDPAPSRNLLRWSQDVGNAVWTKGAAVTVTDNAGTAPDGTATADLVSSTATGQGTLQSIPCLASTVYTVSCYFKAAPSNPATNLLFRDLGGVGGHHLQINPVAGTISASAGVTASGVIAAGNGWYRFWMTYTTEAGQTGIGLQPRLNQTPAPSLGWYVWGLQVERGATLTDYTPTSVAQVDKTANATTQVNTFFGSVAASDLSVSVNASTNVVTTIYSGPAEWSFRRFILHYARLCAAINAADASAVDAFLIGSELKGLTAIRDNASGFPAVSKLKNLAADVKGILGGVTKVGYAADWSEYANYAPADGMFFFME